jgi:DNA invertase Pin-like site-specific DNA recombinase
VNIIEALYCRVSTLDQKTDKQRVNEKSYDLVIEGKCSGGKEIKKVIESGVNFSLSVLSIDRLGRDLRDIINTIHFFTENKITMHFISLGHSRFSKLCIIKYADIVLIHIRG